VAIAAVSVGGRPSGTVDSLGYAPYHLFPLVPMLELDGILTTDRRSLPLCQEINGSLWKPRMEEAAVVRIAAKYLR
jgi:hypothetical protein